MHFSVPWQLHPFIAIALIIALRKIHWRRFYGKPSELDLFNVYVGKVGSGKTTAIAFDALCALKRGEPVFTNVPITVEGIMVYQTVEAWNAAGCPKPAIIIWHEPIELLHPSVRCGLILFDELGAYVNNREHETWPFPLTVKLITLRKHHLSVSATVQDDEMADKNMRRFYNRLFICSEIRIPLLGWIVWHSHRPKLPCRLAGCTKNSGHLCKGDWWSFGTLYTMKDVHPKYSQNKEKHYSRGWWFSFYQPAVAAAFQSQHDDTTKALEIYRKAQIVYSSRQRQRSHYGRGDE